MINTHEILETITMIQDENLDIRTVTMGISLLDCMDADIDKACEKVYNKIVSTAKNLVPVCNDIETELGIPIINKRISVTPIGIIASACKEQNPVKFALALEKAACCYRPRLCVGKHWFYKSRYQYGCRSKNG